MDEPPTTVPSLVPARMLNEFTYCPRFFHLAWSSGEYGENELTVEGKWNHRRVDRVSGAVPKSGEGDVRRAHALDISSATLGMRARIDAVEGRDGTVIPIEYKAGSPKDENEPLWEPERVQLLSHCMLLRDAGYACDHGEVYFTGSRQRFRIDLEPDGEQRVKDLLRSLRDCAEEPVPPPPLVDSPKCPTCVMAPACLPDEHNMMLSRSSMPPRRLVPAEDAASPLYATEPGAFLGRDGERMSVRQRGKLVSTVRLIDVSQVNIFGNIQISSQLIRELFSREVPVCWFSGGGFFYGIGQGLSGRNVELRRRQVLISHGEALACAAAMIEGKILNSRVLLMRNTTERHTPTLQEMKRLAVRTRGVAEPSGLLALEGAAARLYFRRFASMLRDEQTAAGFDFSKRTRRPPSDRVNCLLSFAYSLLVKDCTVTAAAIGLDPYQGIYHRPRFGRPALGLDLAEEFRPLVADSVVITLINNGEISPSHFLERGEGVGLTYEGRRVVLTAYERRMATKFRHPTFQYRLTYRRALEVQARMFAAVLMGEFEAYRAVVTR